jgi:hypothetical protein
MFTTSYQPMRIRRTVTVDGHTIRYQPSARGNARRRAIAEQMVGVR